MNSRERMLGAMRREPVDRIPTDIWMTGEVQAQLKAHFGQDADLNQILHIDATAGVGPRYIGPAIPDMPPGHSTDFWGMKRQRLDYGTGSYDEQYFHPLAEARTIDDLEAYQWPSADWFDYSDMAQRARQARERQAVQCGYMAPFYFHNLLRGLEQSLMDPLEAPQFTDHLLRRLGDFFYEHHRRMFEACRGLIDIAQVTDDLGTQTGPMISLDAYRRFYRSHHQRFVNLCHEFGILVLHHDDGAIRDFLPDLIEIGIDVLNPIQWRCPGMEPRKLKQDFGHRLCFHGAIDNQQTLPHGTEAEVRAEVRRMIDELASDGTGYVLAPCHNIQPVTPLGNILAMYDEAWKYGRIGR